MSKRRPDGSPRYPDWREYSYLPWGEVCGERNGWVRWLAGSAVRRPSAEGACRVPLYLPRIHLTRQDAAVRVAVLVGGTALREVTPAAPYRGRCRDCRVSAGWSPSWSPGQCRLRPCRQRI